MESEKGMSVEDYREMMPGFNGILIVDDDATIKDLQHIMLRLNGLYVPWSMSRIMPGRKVAFYIYVRDGKAEVKKIEKCRCMWYEGEGE